MKQQDSNLVVYVAGPYSEDPVRAVRDAIFAGEQLMALGHVPLVPHLHMLWDIVSPKPYEYWMTIATALLLRCDAVLALPGQSPGQDREVALALSRGIPVYYDINSLDYDT